MVRLVRSGLLAGISYLRHPLQQKEFTLVSLACSCGQALRRQQLRIAAEFHTANQALLWAKRLGLFKIIELECALERPFQCSRQAVLGEFIEYQVG